MDIYGNEAYNIRKTLEGMNKIHQRILNAIEKPENKFEKALSIAGTIIGILGIIHIIETVLKWF